MGYEISAQRLQQRLDEYGMKAQELANRTGIDKSSISQYLHGHHAPNNKTAAKIASVLGGNPAWYMGFDVDFDIPSEEPGYYTNEDSADVAQALHDNPNLRILFDAARDVPPEDLLRVAAMIKAFKDSATGGDNDG